MRGPPSSAWKLATTGSKAALVERLYLHLPDPSSETEPEREDVPDAAPESEDSSESSSEFATTEPDVEDEPPPRPEVEPRRRRKRKAHRLKRSTSSSSGSSSDSSSSSTSSSDGSDHRRRNRSSRLHGKSRSKHHHRHRSSSSSGSSTDSPLISCVSTPVRRMVKKIKRGEYTDFDKWLSPTDDAVPQSRKTKRQVCDLQSWLEARNIHLAIRFQTAPKTALQLVKYRTVRYVTSRSDHLVPAVFCLPSCIGPDIRPAISGGSGHSLRIGATTVAARSGLPPAKIKNLGRWRSEAYKVYTRHPLTQPSNSAVIASAQ